MLSGNYAIAKSLIKHLLVSDLGKRFGNLKNGVEDIKSHRWFRGFYWAELLEKRLLMPYVPVVRSVSDTSHFTRYPDSETLPRAIRKEEDPFLSW